MAIVLIVFILVLGFLVLVHELGHFVTAKKFGAGVEEFGIGFPPRMIKKEHRGTVYSLNWLPLGGFVKIKGEDPTDEHAQDSDSFMSRPPWQRAIILAAGVTMNVLAAWVILIVLFSFGAPTQISENIPKEYIVSSDVVVDEILADSPAYGAGIRAGDTLESIDGNAVTSIETLQDYISEKAGESVSVEYSRGSNFFRESITPQVLADVGIERAIIGVSLQEAGIVKYPVHKAFIAGSQATYSYVQRILSAFYNIMQRLANRQGVGDTLGGPVAIAVATNDVVDLGLPYVLIFTAILSLNLAIINILPIPALDGGRLIFLLVEKIRKKPSRQEVEAWFHRAGFALLILLAVFITYRDFVRFGGRIWGAIVG